MEYDFFKSRDACIKDLGVALQRKFPELKKSEISSEMRLLREGIYRSSLGGVYFEVSENILED